MCFVVACTADDTGSVSSSSGVGSSSGPAVDKLRWEQAYSGPDLSAAVKQLQPAHRYLLRVRAINEIGPSHWSQPLAAATAAAPPCQPCRLSGAPESSSSVVISWQPPEVDNGAPVTAYHLEIQQSSGWVNVWQGSKLSHVVGGLLPGRRYSWRVRAVNSCGVGPWSAPVTASTAPTVPDAPAKPSLSKLAATSAKVKWGIPLEDNGATVKLYCVQLRQLRANPAAAGSDGSDSIDSSSSDEQGVSASWQEVYSGPLLDFNVTKLQPGSTYEVRVAAANAVGLGSWSAAAELTTPLRPPPPPGGLAAVLAASLQGAVEVSWSQGASAGPDNAAAVSVYVEAVAVGSKEAAAKATVPVAEGSTVTLQGLKQGATYNVKARAVGAGSTGHSQWCDAVTVALPAPPQSLELAAVGGAAPGADAGEAQWHRAWLVTGVLCCDCANAVQHVCACCCEHGRMVGGGGGFPLMHARHVQQQHSEACPCLRVNFTVVPASLQCPTVSACWPSGTMLFLCCCLLVVQANVQGRPVGPRVLQVKLSRQRQALLQICSRAKHPGVLLARRLPLRPLPSKSLAKRRV